MALEAHSQNIKDLNKELAPTKQTPDLENPDKNELSYMMEFVPPDAGTPAAKALQGMFDLHSFHRE
jgi:hypothetical protein